MQHSTNDFIERILKSDSILQNINKYNLAESMIHLAINGLILKQTDLKDEMPSLCKLIRIGLDWYYVLPAELI